MRVCALSKSYFGQCTITELIGHSSSRTSRPQPINPPGVLPTQGYRDGESQERPAVLARRRSAPAGTSATQTPCLQHRTGDIDDGCAKQGGAVDFQFDATTDRRGWLRALSSGQREYS
jgi:hypothetical protein